MKIVIDEFLERQFDPNFSGTSLCFEPSTNKSLFNRSIDLKVYYTDLLNIHYNNIQNYGNVDDIKLVNADDPKMDFCKYLIFYNHSPVKQGTISITKDIEPFIKTEYKARTENELPILTRYVELPEDFETKKANYLVCILYSKEQLRKEYKGDLKVFDSIYTEDVEYGCIAILGTQNPEVDPMPPITMMRNALGVDEGGNGIMLDKEQYKKSVDFWSNNILIKK